jgi:hypothetical protein
MENCYNHPERKAYSVCHNCGKYFCEDCLTAGPEFYYCKSPECQQKLQEDTEGKSYRIKITCPNCQSVLELSRDDVRSPGFRCPECDTFIVLLNGEPETLEDKNYVQLLTTSNQGDAAIIKSMMENAEVDYYLTGENSIYEPMVLFVNERDIEVAKDILKDFEVHLFGFSANNEEE